MVVRENAAADGLTFKIYTDGARTNAGAASPATVIAASANPLSIGKPNAGDSTDVSFQGSIDQVAIWNRALSASEVTALFNGNGVVP